MLIDTHSHLDLEEDILGLLEKSKQNLVTEIISISTDLESSKKNIEIWDWISPTFPKNFVDLVEEQRKII